MKTHITKLLFTLAAPMAISLSAVAASADYAYYIEDPAVKDRISVHNDGRNTYVAASRGLVVPGATADGQSFIIHGVPSRFEAELKGKEITFVRGQREVPKPVVKPKPKETASSLKTQIDSLKKEIEKLDGGAEAQALAVEPVKPPAPIWKIRAGEKISDVLTAWSKTSGTQFVMDAEDGMFRIDAQIQGEFVEAVTQVVDGLNRSGKNIQAVFSNNQKVLRIKEK